MIKQLFLYIIFLIFSTNIFSQDFHKKKIVDLIKDKKFSSAQAICHQLIIDGKDDYFIDYYNAYCSKELFLNDAYDLYVSYLQKYDYSEFSHLAYKDIGLLHFRRKEYEKAVLYLEKIEDLNKYKEIIFKIGYAKFCLDLYNDANYYFSQLTKDKNKYSSAARYYNACIAYEKKLFKTALAEFTYLSNDKTFGHVAPYYIAHIYYAQKKFKNLVEFIEPILSEINDSRIEEVYRLLAESFYALKDYKKAVKYYVNYLKYNDQISSSTCFFLGHSYYRIKDYDKAIYFLEKVVSSPDSIMQPSTYYLASSYLKNNNTYYALQAFKKAGSYDFSFDIKEEAFFNYAKLSYELEMPFDNTLDILESYLKQFENAAHSKHIELLIAKTLKGTSRYKEALLALEEIYQPNYEQQGSIQQLSYFLGVKEYNSANYNSAIKYFNQSKKYNINSEFYFLSNFWLAESYYQISDIKKSIEIYKSLPATSNDNLKYYEVLSNYNLGYCYFDLKNFSLSNQFFRAYEKQTADSMRLNDCYLRIADGFFMTNKYRLAEQYYSKAIDINIFDSDYAIYFRSKCLNLLGEYEDQIIILKHFIDNYPSSRYLDDVLFSLANYYKNSEQYGIATAYYDSVLSFSNDQNLVPNSLLSKGMIFYNTNLLTEAAIQFTQIIESFPKTKFFKQALAGLQSAYTTLGEVEKYLDIIEEIPTVNLTESQQDSLIYNTAFLKFSESSYQVANSTFEKYIARFQNSGIFINDAKYYNAVCLEQLNESEKAEAFYIDLVASNASNYYRENASLYLARKFYNEKNFQLSNKYYLVIDSIASSNANAREAIVKLMQGFQKLDTIQAFKYANKVLSLEKIDDQLVAQANLINARVEFSNGNYAKSRIIFQKIYNVSKNSPGAEAAYYLAYLTYLEDSLVLAEKMIFKLAEDFNDDYFTAKGFILLADIYIDQGNNFQAKAALESIIVSYSGNQDLVNEARKKNEKILQKEIQDTNIKVSPIYIDILEEGIDDELDTYQNILELVDENYEVEVPDSLMPPSNSILKNENEKK